MNRIAAFALFALPFVACTTDIPLGTSHSCHQSLARACNDPSAPASIDWGDCQADGTCACLDGAELTDGGRCRPSTVCDGGLCANLAPTCTPGRDQECNEDLSMSSLAGVCGADGRCTCSGAFESGPLGKCRPTGSFCFQPDAGPTRADGGAPPAAGLCESAPCGLGGRCEADAGVATCVANATVAGCIAPTCGAVSCGAGCRCTDADAGYCACPPPDRCTPNLPITCSDESDPMAATCSRPDGGSSVCACNSGYSLDPLTHHCLSDFLLFGIDTPVGSLAMAPVPGEAKVGVAYLAARGDAGFEVRFVEVTSQGASAPLTLDTTGLDFGVALAFDPSGEPAIGYLGGGAAAAPFWVNSDAVLARRSGTTFTHQAVATGGAQAVCGNVVSDRGDTVGLYPALAITSQGSTFFSWRDVHDGMFPMQDFAGSDLEVATDNGTSSWVYECARAGGNDKNAWGGHGRVVLANDAPALVSDQLVGVAAGNGQNVVFMRRPAAGNWTTPVTVFAQAVVEGGPAIAYDPALGYLVVSQDGSGDVRLATSADGASWAPELVVGGGLAGAGPDVAVSPVTHQLQIVAATAGSLRLFHRNVGAFSSDVIVNFTTARPRLTVLPNGKRVVAFVDVANGFLRVAIER